jgi:hypothetical protein
LQTQPSPDQNRPLASPLAIKFLDSSDQVLQQNYLNKMLYSPDYQGVDMTQVGGNPGGGFAGVLV